MSSAALRSVRPDADAVWVHLRLPLREVTLLYALAYLAHAVDPHVPGAVAAGEGVAATALHRTTCRLYVALRETTSRGGL